MAHVPEALDESGDRLLASILTGARALVRAGEVAMLAAARRRRLDVIVCTKLDRLARSVRHLVNVAAELEALGVDLVCCDQPGLDSTVPSGKLLFHILGSISEFERSLIVDRVRAGLARARAQGKHLGRPRVHQVDVTEALELRAQGLSLRATARALGVPHMAVQRALAARCMTIRLLVDTFCSE